MHIITTTEELAAFVAPLMEAPFVAVDTEFMRERTYWPQLCLIQVATPGTVAVIDPLEGDGMDLAPFFALMRAPGVTKVFHAPRQDIEILWHLNKCIPAPLFDTQTAAMALGYGENVSYHTLVKTLLKKELDKTQQYTHWQQRPLKEAQLTYAADDVIYLCEVYARLATDIAARGRMAWIAEEMAALTSPTTYSPDPEQAYQRVRHNLKRPAQIAAVRALAAWRDREAQHRNTTRQMVLKDDQLAEIAKHLPTTAEELQGIRNIRRMSEKTTQAILEALKEAAAAPAESVPQLLRRPEVMPDSDLVGLLSLLLKIRCREEDVAPKLVAGRAALEAIVLGRMDVPAMQGWRWEIFGSHAKALMDGSLSVSWDAKTGVQIR